MWKWIVGVVVVIGVLLCVGGGVVGGGWLWARYRAERAAGAAEEAAAEQAAAADAAADAATMARTDSLAAARAAAAGGDATSAVDAYSDVLEGDPDNVEALLGRGRAYAKLERLDLAEEDLRGVTGRDPANREAWSSLGWVLGRMGRDGEAVQAYDRVLALAGEEPQALRDRGNARYRAGDVAGARTDAARACALGLPDGCALEERIAAATRR